VPIGFLCEASSQLRNGKWVALVLLSSGFFWAFVGGPWGAVLVDGYDGCG